MNDRENARLLYLDAGNIDDDQLDVDGLDVLDPSGTKLGDLDGFIVHRDTKRPYYAVVDSGGWFSSRRFLVPIGHARLDTAEPALRVDLERGTIERFPEFDEDRFGELTEDEARLFNERTLTACCATELRGRAGADRYDYGAWSHYAQPDWWRSTWFTAAPEGMSTGTATMPPAHEPAARPLSRPTAPVERERVTARDREAAERDRSSVDPLERAQPGDVLGIEHAGETTALGDTADDERERLKDAEEDAPPLRRDERRDRDL